MKFYNINAYNVTCIYCFHNSTLANIFIISKRYKNKFTNILYKKTLMTSLNLTNNFPSRTSTGVFTNGSSNANNNGWNAQGSVGYGNRNAYGAIHVGRDAGWNGRGSNSIGISGGFRF